MGREPISYEVCSVCVNGSISYREWGIVLKNQTGKFDFSLLLWSQANFSIFLFPHLSSSICLTLTPFFLLPFLLPSSLPLPPSPLYPSPIPPPSLPLPLPPFLSEGQMGRQTEVPTAPFLSMSPTPQNLEYLLPTIVMHCKMSSLARAPLQLYVATFPDLISHGNHCQYSTVMWWANAESYLCLVGNPPTISPSKISYTK